jgi:hypothetical protein
MMLEVSAACAGVVGDTDCAAADAVAAIRDRMIWRVRFITALLSESYGGYGPLRPRISTKVAKNMTTGRKIARNEGAPFRMMARPFPTLS